MKKDIEFNKVENISVAVARKPTETDEYDWHVYLINDNHFPIINVLVTSKGYGFKGEEKQMTSTLRHLIEEVGAGDFAVVERIDPSVFHLYNEYWVSYYVKDKIYDKKFIFVPEAIIEDHLVMIDKLNMEGVLHS
ncbi:MAG: hypothetical protein H7Y04_09900 [Verrucomicrobia bacterium]|nr:hypothetical protein [Cytophagales bacterium]